MKDIPIYTGNGGIATLILKEIPYKKAAYVLIRSLEFDKMKLFLGQCWEFCKSVGAQHVYVSGREPIPGLPYLYDLLRLWRPAEIPIPSDRVFLEPVTKQTAKDYAELYQKLFSPFPGAATYTEQKVQEIVQRGGIFFAIEGKKTIGIGELWDQEIRCIGVLPGYRGKGTALLASLLEKVEGDAWLEVASNNLLARKLYEKLGFCEEQILSHWYCLDSVFKE